MSEIRQKLDELKIERNDDSHEGGTSRRWIIWVVAGLLLAALAGWWWSRPGVAEVTVAVAREVELGGVQTVLNASGYVTARRQATVSSKVTGKVVEVLIEEGMAVQEGQVLARLDASNVNAAYRLSDAQLAQARTQLEETRRRRCRRSHRGGGRQTPRTAFARYRADPCKPARGRPVPSEVKAAAPMDSPPLCEHAASRLSTKVERMGKIFFVRRKNSRPGRRDSKPS